MAHYGTRPAFSVLVLLTPQRYGHTQKTLKAWEQSGVYLTVRHVELEKLIVGSRRLLWVQACHQIHAAS